MRFLMCAVHTYMLVNSVWSQGQDSIRVQAEIQLNSSFPETYVHISADGNEIFFSTARGGQRWSDGYTKKSVKLEERTLVYDSDIWSAEWNGKKWEQLNPLPFGINTSHIEEQPFLSIDGKFLIYQSWGYIWERTKGPYYVIKREEDKWTPPKGLGGGITQFFQEYPASDGITFTPNLKELFLISSLNEFVFNELFSSRKTTLGWSYPDRISPTIEGNKKSITISPNGEWMFYAAESENGYGGYDIYVVYFYEGKPVGEHFNLGESINSSKDEYSFSITKDMKKAYFIRQENIYSADFSQLNWENYKPDFMQNTYKDN